MLNTMLLGNERLSLDLLSKLIDLINDTTFSSEVRVIRENPWPLILENKSLENNQIIKELSSIYKISEFVIAEFITNLQAIGFISGTKKTVSQETIQTQKGKTQEEIAKTLIDGFMFSGEIDNNLIEKLDVFFQRLSEFEFIKMMFEKGITRSQIPWGIIRGSSLFDINYSKFKKLDSLLDFYIVNFEMQEKIFGNKLMDMMLETGGIPVDDILEKQSIIFPNRFFGKVGEIDYDRQILNIIVRLVPGFSPTGIGFVFGIDFDGNNSNYFTKIFINFEKRDGKIVPIINTIQNSTGNIGETQDGKIVPINEPFDKNILSSRKRSSLFESIGRKLFLVGDYEDFLSEYIDLNGFDPIYPILNGAIDLKSLKSKSFIEQKNLVIKILSNLRKIDVNIPFLMIILFFLIEKGFDYIELIDGKENLWLRNHNSNRDENSVGKSLSNIYNEKGIMFGGKRLENGRYGIFKKDFYLRTFGRNIDGVGFYNIGMLVDGMSSMFPNGDFANLSRQIGDELLQLFIGNYR